MEVAGEHAAPVIQQCIAAFEIELLGKRHHGVAGRMDLAALAGRNVDSEMRRRRRAVQDALAAEKAADDPAVSVPGQLRRLKELAVKYSG